MDDADRYTRQRRLAEVGPGGQDALAAASLRIGTVAGAMTAMSYLLRAGVRDVSMNTRVEERSFPHAAAFHHGPAATHAAGAWRALRHIIAVLESTR